MGHAHYLQKYEKTNLYKKALKSLLYIKTVIMFKSHL